jgi:predicted transposase YdaD
MTVTAKEAIKTMCNLNEVIEERGRIEGREQGAEQNKLDNALRMIADGELSLEKIAAYTDLPLERVQELAAKKPA